MVEYAIFDSAGDLVERGFYGVTGYHRARIAAADLKLHAPEAVRRVDDDWTTGGARRCPAHDITDKRGDRATELDPLPACQHGMAYGAWSESMGGFVYHGDCATEVANWAADELRSLAKDDDTDTIKIFPVCPYHEEQPKDDCEECDAESEDEEEDEDEDA